MTEVSAPRRERRKQLLLTSVLALGVVFGDIGTSPLYALREALSPARGVVLGPDSVLGVLSLIIWSLVLVVTVKYLVVVLRADNKGEGGTLALLSLLPDAPRGRLGGLLLPLGLFGAALLYGDGLITPAISVLSAVEGIGVVTPALGAYVVPLTIGILVCLFMVQGQGTARLGRVFGPVCLLWFLVLAALGVRGILLAPEVLGAFNPVYGLAFLATHGAIGFFVLGGVFLAVTGAEALYADMGHFGAGPIRFTWLSLVFPALVLNYLGQGGLLLHQPEALRAPFYLLAPSWALAPLVVLATMATIIASQAVISGAFSLTRQAVQLGFLPRLDIRHTSAKVIGQIYVPQVNWALMVGTVLLVLAFGSSAALAGAYGIAVSGTMVITSLLLYHVATQRWGWPRALAALGLGALLCLEVVFFAANLTKVLDGGWFPLALAAGIFLVMTTWWAGRALLRERLAEISKPVDAFLADLRNRGPTRVRGNAVYMGGSHLVPPALVKNLQHNRVLHMQVVLLNIVTEAVPHVPREGRVSVDYLGLGVHKAVARYGFLDNPDAVDVLTLLDGKGVQMPLDETTFFLGRERVVSTERPGLARWREELFAFLTRNAQPATAYFRIPPDRVIEVGSQVEL